MVAAAATPLALGLPVPFLLLWFSTRKGLHPQATLSQEITKRQPDNLMPIDANRVPDEVRPIVTALNDPLTRMEQTLELMAERDLHRASPSSTEGLQGRGLTVRFAT